MLDTSKELLKKCRLAVKLVLDNIDFWGSYGLKLPKDQYFQKPISLPIYIF